MTYVIDLLGNPCAVRAGIARTLVARIDDLAALACTRER